MLTRQRLLHANAYYTLHANAYYTARGLDLGQDGLADGWPGGWLAGGWAGWGMAQHGPVLVVSIGACFNVSIGARKEREV